MDCNRVPLFDCLYRRLGELTAHVGRYHMQVLALACMLTDEVVLQRLIDDWQIEARIDVISRLMDARHIPPALKDAFLAIHHRMRPVLERQALTPAHPAVATQIGLAQHLDAKYYGTSPSWFNRTGGISKDEVSRSIASVERDILTAAHTYLSLATLSSRVGRAFVESATPAQTMPMMAAL